MQNLLALLGTHWRGAAVLLAVFVDISPIKINPVRWALRRMGDLMFGSRLDELCRTVDENEMDRIRYTVLSFAASCRAGTEHSQDEFMHIMQLKDKYDALLRRHGRQNGVFTEEYKYILRVYNREK